MAVHLNLNDKKIDPKNEEPRAKGQTQVIKSTPCRSASGRSNVADLQVRKWEEYKGTRYFDGDSVLVVELWLHRVADDLSGLTFQEWDPSSGSDDSTRWFPEVVVRSVSQ